MGVVAQIPFLSQTLYTGPVTTMLDGADISWIVGLALYHPLARRHSRAPAEPIPADAPEPSPTS